MKVRFRRVGERKKGGSTSFYIRAPPVNGLGIPGFGVRYILLFRRSIRLISITCIKFQAGPDVLFALLRPYMFSLTCISASSNDSFSVAFSDEWRRCGPGQGHQARRG